MAGGPHRCSVCGLSSPVGDVFTDVRTRAGRGVVCLPCRRRQQRRVPLLAALVWIAAPLVLALVHVAGAGYLPFVLTEPGWFASTVAVSYRVWLTAIMGAAPLVLAAALLLVVLHETGHAVAARLAGVQLNEVSVGVGPQVAAVRIGPTRLVLRLVPLAGHTMTFPTAGLSASRAAAIAGAGPLMDALVLAGALYASPGRLATTLAFVAGVGLATNLLPLSVSGQATDGLHLWQLMTIDGPAAPDDFRPTTSLLARASALHRDGRLEQAASLCEQGLQDDPGDTALASLLAATQLDLGDAAGARRCLLGLLGAELPDTRRAVTFANLAWADLLLDDPALLPEALDASATAIKALPAEPAVRSTRGFALVESGRVEEGLMLLAEALTRLRERRHRATVLAVQSIGQARLGRLRDARASLQRAQRLVPQDPLLPRARRAIARCEAVLEEPAV